MNNFTATEFSSVQDKEKFYKQFIKFVESNYNRTYFPKWFYTRLSMTFGHIAQYNQGTFYRYFFSDSEGKQEFIEHLKCDGGYGDPAYTFSDVEKALKQYFHFS